MNIYSAMNIASSSLTTSQAQIAVVGNNIANADNENYHREVATTTSYNYGIYVSSVTRVFDATLENSLQGAISDSSYCDTYETRLSEIESLLGPDGENNLSDAVTAFATAYEDVATSPEDTSSRSSLLAAAATLCSEINQQYSNLGTLRDAIASNDSTGSGYISTQVDEVNSLLQQISDLNTSIYTIENTGYESQEASTLRDERDALIKELAQYIDISYTEDDTTGGYTVSINTESGSYQLVDGSDLTASVVTLSYSMTDTASTGFYTPQISLSDGTDITLLEDSGSIRALLDAREYICDTMTDLYDYAVAIADAVNTVQASGYDLNGNTSGDTGFVDEILTYSSSQPTSGDIISVNSSIVGQPRLIAAASADNSNGDGTNATAAYTALNDSSGYNGASLIDGADTILTQVSLDVSIASSEAESADAVVSMYEDAIAELSAVSSDEEMVDMLELQRTYQAAAKMFTALDEMIQSVLAMVG